MFLDTEQQWFHMGGVAFFKVSSFFKKLGKPCQKLTQNDPKILQKLVRRVPKNVVQNCNVNKENLMKQGLQKEV